MITCPSPYLLAEPPTSTGRALLARAFAHWCMIHHGLSSEDIANALPPLSEAAQGDLSDVRFAARLIGEMIAAGRIRSFARPFGGGSPAPIPADDWELDDFTDRFARSAYDPIQPFALSAEPTHWIFVDLIDFNGVVEESCADLRPIGPLPRVDHRPIVRHEVTESNASGNDLVRLKEVMRRTGMSRSTIYRRIEQGRFPTQIPMDGNIAAWREADIAAWLAAPN